MLLYGKTSARPFGMVAEATSGTFSLLCGHKLTVTLICSQRRRNLFKESGFVVWKW
jgi:hypothetical protein